MNALCIIDTSIFTNLLNVPTKNELKDKVIDDFKAYIGLGFEFILPMTTVIETGNHIAQNGDGSLRRKIAKQFCGLVRDALTGQAPYRISPMPDIQFMLNWLDNFPDHAGKNKHSAKRFEGTSFGDLLIIKEFERLCGLNPNAEIFIWSLDQDLAQYRQNAPFRSSMNKTLAD